MANLRKCEIVVSCDVVIQDIRYEISYILFLMIRRHPRSTLSSSSAASDVYKRQILAVVGSETATTDLKEGTTLILDGINGAALIDPTAVSYTHLRAHDT
ncbi:phosphoenolpyruvate-protein phosphatase [Lactobacillus plantarum JDM1] [Lactiplantibacillus mudanjiangensis]|nr:phosphoenolpyruvate-protein phosphatase [Lactobacillus plantarum JDM1] [Lactiplantibacillus mudanjiangensis]